MRNVLDLFPSIFDEEAKFKGGIWWWLSHPRPLSMWPTMVGPAPDPSLHPRPAILGAPSSCLVCRVATGVAVGGGGSAACPVRYPRRQRSSLCSRQELGREPGSRNAKSGFDI